MTKLSSIDINTLHKIAKYGDLIMNEMRNSFGNSGAPHMLQAQRVRKLADAGYCKIEMVGESIFVVATAATLSAAPQYDQRKFPRTSPRSIRRLDA